ncbi:MAG: cache domain-containing protein [Defluviitaleaceae bacterium]|nr:cache domain-containing protein [Defluviitaleaceae bacterium]
MFNSLKSKLIVPTLLVVLVLVGAIVIFAVMQTHRLSDNLTHDRIISMSGFSENWLETFDDMSRVVALSVSRSPGLINAIDTWMDGYRPAARAEMLPYLQVTAREMSVSSFIIHANDGTVILRMHDPRTFDDDNSNYHFVAAAMQGHTTTTYAVTDDIPFGLLTTIPINRDGQNIGSVTAIFYMFTEEFVDDAARIFNAQVTVFAGSRRVATTLRDEHNNRVIGTHLDNEEVLNTVLAQGRPIYLQTELLGMSHTAMYLPLRDAAGVIIGMFSATFSNEYAMSQTNTMVALLILIGIVGIVVAAVLMYFLIAKSLKPLTTLSKIVEDVSSGNINVNIDRSNLPKDEIGVLTYDVSILVDVIKTMVDDLSSVHTEYVKLGHIHYRIDDSKYQNSFKEMIALVNQLLHLTTTDIKEIVDTLDLISNGDFSKEVQHNVWIGEWVMVPNALSKLINNLKGVSTEVKAMIEATAIKGDLSFRINADDYKGDWHDIMEGLNNIAQAVDRPLKVIELSMREMQSGNLSLDNINKKIGEVGVDGDAEHYNGVFRNIIAAFDESLIDVASYVNEISENLVLISNRPVPEPRSMIKCVWVNENERIRKNREIE